MRNLEEVESGKYCRIVWLLGSVGKYLRSTLDLDEDDELYVRENNGVSLIIAKGEKRYALDAETAHWIKVEV